MTPDGFVERLARYREVVENQAPTAVEHALRNTAARNPPQGISVIVGRTTSGVRVQLSGPGARRYARSMSRRLGPVAQDAYAQAVR